MSRVEGPDPGPGLDFSGRVAVVTGGTRGVGLAIVRAFLGAGAEVMTCGRHEPEEGVLTGPGPDGGARRASFVTADVREPEQARELMAAAVQELGRLDVLVNNAGGSPEVPAATASPRFITSVVRLNLLAPFFCAQAANEVMQAQPDGGAIVSISSVSGIRPTPGASAYGAAKAGLINLTTTLAVEWAPKVRVNCVTAGLLDTGAGADHYGGAEGLARIAATVPLGRMGVPADVAACCLFLASPMAGYISGSNLVVHGAGEWPAYIAAARGDSGPPTGPVSPAC
jgi:NAD(P)-dependent dehydrogenase (short-subunit alcohol dehydrogenase family)